MAKINVKDTEITIISVEERDYISLTDMANAKESESRAANIIKNWIRSRYTLEFWELGNKSTTRILKWWNLTTLIPGKELVIEITKLK